MTQLVCPTRDQLAQLNSGQLSDEQVLPIGQHLDECASCRSLMEAINNLDDTLASALHRPLADETYLDESGLRRAEALIQAIGREPSFAASPVASAEVAEQSPFGQGSLGRIGPGRIGPYQLLEELGKGGMGTVYKALHTQLDKVVAVKVLPADKLRDAAAVNRFRQEMKAVGRLEHRHIVRATDAGETDGVHFLVMEYVDGIDLSRLVRRLGPLSIADACELARQAALGLQYAHQQQLVHRDIKPANLMLTDATSRAASGAGSSSEPVVKVLDLGLARLRAEQGAAEIPDAEPLTVTGQLMGTLEYMAPEQGADTHSVDIRADIYSLGATLFKLLTGTAPFSATEYNGPMKMLAVLATQPAPSIRTRRDDLPPELVDVIDKMLARDPADRFATPAEVAEALAPFAVGADPARLLVAFNEHSATVLVPPAISASSVVDRGDTAVKTGGKSQAASASRAPSGAGSSRRNKRLLALATLLAGIMLVAGITLFLPTKNGVLKIEINDPAVQVTIDNGNLIITQKNSKQPITLTPGEHTLRIKQGELTFETDSFTLLKGDKLLLRVQRLPGKIQVVEGNKVLGSRRLKKPAGSHRPLAEEWVRRIAKLPAAGQANAVKAELLKRNPGFKGSIGWKTQDGKLTSWTIGLGRLSDLSPLLALEHLKRLEYGALEPRADAVVLRDIKSLEVINGRSATTYRLAFPKNKPSQGEGVTPEWIRQTRALPVERRVKVVLAKLQELNPNFNGQFVHRAVRGTVQRLIFDSTVVTDITPLQVFEKLGQLLVGVRNVPPALPRTGWLSDLSPLKGMKLTGLVFQNTRVMDLLPLKGMPLTNLACSGTRVSDLSVLKGMPLTALQCEHTSVANLSPLTGMRLTHLSIKYTRVSDLSPLTGMPLTELHFTQFSPKNLRIVRGIKTLKTINNRPAAVYWKEIDAKKPSGKNSVGLHRPLAAEWTGRIAKLPVAAQANAVKAELLKRNPGFKGSIGWKVTADNITDWTISLGRLNDLSPLLALSHLQTLEYAALQPRTDAVVLREIKSLELINGRSAATYRLAFPENKPPQGEGVTPDWIKQVRALPVRSRIKAVMAKLQELNPNFDGKYRAAFRRGVVYHLQFNSTLVTDISPLAVLEHLEMLILSFPRPVTSWLSDLSPLKGMPLASLVCSGTRVVDLSPLKGMPLTNLVCSGTRVVDLSPLKGMPLTNLQCAGVPLPDLSLLQGMPLTSLDCGATGAADLSPLKGMKLTFLNCGSNPRITDLSPLTGMPLTFLDCHGTRVADLSPLKGMKLTTLLVYGTSVTDLASLASMPLTELRFDQTTPKNLRIVRGMKTLKTINDKPAAVFWKEIDAKRTAGKNSVGWQRTIDDGDAGYSEVSRKGSLGWQSSQDAEGTKLAYGEDYRYNEDGAATARWTFQKLPPGRYEVFVTWTAQPNRAPKAVYVVYDGKKGNKPGVLDQRKSPDDIRTAGLWWKSLGKYQISRATLVVELDARISSGGGVIADAVRIVRIK